MRLSPRERRLVVLLFVVLVGSVGLRFWSQRSAGPLVGAQPAGTVSPSPSIALSVAPSPTFSVPADARDPFQP